MRYLATLASGLALSCFVLATAQAQSLDVPAPPVQNPIDNLTVDPSDPSDGSTGRNLDLMVPDGYGGLIELPALQDDPVSSIGSVLIAPTDPHILPPER
jgi:hypothetical protein